MGQWKIGYPGELHNAASYDAGKLLYNRFGVLPISLSTNTMCRAVGQINSVGDPGGSVLTCKNITNYPNIANTIFSGAPTVFEIDEFNNGYVRFLSGVCENKVYKVDDTTATELDTDTDLVTAGVLPDDYFEVVSGSITFEFPSKRNPTRRDFKRTFKGSSFRFPFYEGGIVIPIGYEPDDFVIMTYLTDERDADRLEIICSHLLDYKGFDGMYSTGGASDNSDGLAPMVLETGSNDIKNQYLVYINDYKIVKDSKRSDDFWEVMIHFMNYSRPSYRGI